MRLVSVLCVTVLALGICTAVALGDKDPKSQEPEWHWDLSGTRATYAEVEPNNDCATAQAMACGDVINPARLDVSGDYDWYAFQGTAGIPITVGTDASDLCDPDAGDTYIYLYASDCTTILAQDDDLGPGYYSLISNFNAAYTGTYYAVVRGYSPSYTGCYKLFVNCAPPATGACCLAGGVCEIRTQAACGTGGGTYMGDNTVCAPNPCPQPPANDTCAGAIDVPCGTGQLSGNTSAAVNDYSPPSGGCTGYSANGKDVAYSMNLIGGDVVDMTYTMTGVDASFYIVTDCSNVAGSCVAGADAGYNIESIHYVAGETRTYYLILDAYSTNAGGPWTLDYSITCPPQEVACCFPDGHCEMLPEANCIAQGGVVVAGALCEPVNPCEQPPMACCFPDGHCEFVSGALCVELGGTAQGYGTSCEPNLCPQPVVACCFADGHCEMQTSDQCLALEGAPQGLGTTCEPNLCPQPPATGACCLDDQGHCVVATEAACADQNGQYQGDGSTCEPVNPCPIVPTKNSTWGQIKANYR